MLTWIILALLAYGFYTGFKRGFLLQMFYSIAYLIAYFIAATHYKGIAKQLELWIPFPSATSETKMVFFSQKTSFELDKAFYAGIAFLLIYCVCYLVIRLAGLFLHKLNMVPILGKANKIVGGIFGLGAVYTGVFFVLTLGSMIPVNALQSRLSNDLLADAIIERSPFLTKDIHRLWIENILGKV